MKTTYLITFTLFLIFITAQVSSSVYYTIHPTELIIVEHKSTNHEQMRKDGYVPEVGEEYAYKKETRVLRKGHIFYVEDVVLDTAAKFVIYAKK